MSGYDWSNGMSNNAVAAYDHGLTTSAKVATSLNRRFKIKITGAWVRQHFTPHERHHTSKKFRLTDFFAIEACAAAMSPALIAEAETFTHTQRQANATPEFHGTISYEHWHQWYAPPHGRKTFSLFRISITGRWRRKGTGAELIALLSVTRTCIAGRPVAVAWNQPQPGTLVMSTRKGFAIDKQPPTAETPHLHEQAANT